MLRGFPGLCQGYPEAILPAEGVGPLLELTQALFDQPIGQRGSALFSRSRKGTSQGGMLMSESPYCRLSSPQPPGSTPSPIRVASHVKQGIHTASIISSTEELRCVEVGDMACESALRSAGTHLSRVRAPPSTPRPDGGLKSLRSPCCGLAIYKNPKTLCVAQLTIWLTVKLSLSSQVNLENGKKKELPEKRQRSRDCHLMLQDQTHWTRFKCFEVIDEKNRARLIDAFNTFPSKDAQDAYVASLITVTDINRHRPRLDEPKKSNSNSYHYKVFTKSDNNEDPDGFTSQLLTVVGSMRIAPPQCLMNLRDHISSFRRRQSHDSKERTRRLYLPQDLNIHKMYLLFNENHLDGSLSYESYGTIFNTEFNISFGYSKSDTCSAYDQFKAKIEVLTKTSTDTPNEAVRRELEQLTNQRDLHQRMAETFYRRKKDAMQGAKTTPHLQSFTFN
ncbi:vitamin B12-dependent ribonucleotide reductase [Plakobranchus ocellatus]|uniref:Vitamin B12-dependent ribonucleotide reductase n=1 Tax=Plakobranchus ocellatus TaxID=259542 RepID=A0AAV4B0X0_9GAST|nr:vitamin B12-dependent ribonucleotide reductase [Plakobranchus ocellatus]